MSPETRRFGIGLRTQTVAALVLAYSCALLMLGYVVVKGIAAQGANGTDAVLAVRNLPLLFLLYAGVTGAALVLSLFILLTRSIVRPLEALTRASERLAAGDLQTQAPIAGGAEVARLAVAFNEMARQLRDDRLALDEKVRSLETRTRELREAQEGLIRTERLASVGRLGAGLAHEVGNPLAAIVGLVELVRTGDLSAQEQAEFLGRVQRETERIQRIIRGLLDFARQDPTSGQLGPVAIAGAIEAAKQLLSQQMHHKDITFALELAPELPPVTTDADRLQQVLLNILLNAIDAVPVGGNITVRVFPRDSEKLVLSIVDSGPGIAPEMMNKIFEPFATSKDVGKGTGLGLAVARTLLVQMGGEIHASNHKDGGACFELVLPVATSG